MIVEIRSFEVRVDGGDHAKVDLFVRILNDRNGEVRASKSFTAARRFRAAAMRPMSPHSTCLWRHGQADRPLDGFAELVSLTIGCPEGLNVLPSHSHRDLRCEEVRIAFNIGRSGCNESGHVDLTVREGVDAGPIPDGGQR